MFILTEAVHFSSIVPEKQRKKLDGVKEALTTAVKIKGCRPELLCIYSVTLYGIYSSLMLKSYCSPFAKCLFVEYIHLVWVF